MELINDYVSFNLENKELLSELKEEKTMTYDLLEPVIDTLDFLAKVNLKVEGEDEEDCIDVFQIGFNYIYQEVDLIKRILEENFDDDIDELLQYDHNLYLYLRVDEIDTILNEQDEMISGLLDRLSQTFEYRSKLTNEMIDLVEKEIERGYSNTDEESIVDTFMDFADSLGLELI